MEEDGREIVIDSEAQKKHVRYYWTSKENDQEYCPIKGNLGGSPAIFSHSVVLLTGTPTLASSSRGKHQAALRHGLSASSPNLSLLHTQASFHL